MSTAVPEPIPVPDPRRCVFCGAIAVHTGSGHVEWAITPGMPPGCEHETIYGQD